jgi:hypothetical protein
MSKFIQRLFGRTAPTRLYMAPSHPIGNFTAKIVNCEVRPTRAKPGSYLALRVAVGPGYPSLIIALTQPRRMIWESQLYNWLDKQGIQPWDWAETDPQVIANILASATNAFLPIKARVVNSGQVEATLDL